MPAYLHKLETYPAIKILEKDYENDITAFITYISNPENKEFVNKFNDRLIADVMINWKVNEILEMRNILKKKFS